MSKTLGTLIHEIGHFLAKDGHRTHVEFIENTWVRIYEKMEEKSV